MQGSNSQHLGLSTRQALLYVVDSVKHSILTATL